MYNSMCKCLRSSGFNQSFSKGFANKMRTWIDSSGREFAVSRVKGFKSFITKFICESIVDTSILESSRIGFRKTRKSIAFKDVFFQSIFDMSKSELNQAALKKIFSFFNVIYPVRSLKGHWSEKSNRKYLSNVMDPYSSDVKSFISENFSINESSPVDPLPQLFEFNEQLLEQCFQESLKAQTMLTSKPTPGKFSPVMILEVNSRDFFPEDFFPSSILLHETKIMKQVINQDSISWESTEFPEFKRVRYVHDKNQERAINVNFVNISRSDPHFLDLYPLLYTSIGQELIETCPFLCERAISGRNEGLIDLLRNNYLPLPYNSRMVGTACSIPEKGCKRRSVANPSWIYQLITEPLKLFLGALSSQLYEAGVVTFNQDGARIRILEMVSSNHGQMLHSYDASSFTDRFPVEYQFGFLDSLWGLMPAERQATFKQWFDAFKIISKGIYHDIDLHVDIHWEVGQPQGLNPSFHLACLTHWWLIMQLLGTISPERQKEALVYNREFLVLGDDVFIRNHDLAEVYHNFMVNSGVEINLSKSIISTTFAEFAGKKISNKGIIPSIKPDSDWLDGSRLVKYLDYFGPSFLHVLSKEERLSLNYAMVVQPSNYQIDYDSYVARAVQTDAVRSMYTLLMNDTGAQSAWYQLVRKVLGEQDPMIQFYLDYLSADADKSDQVVRRDLHPHLNDYLNGVKLRLLSIDRNQLINDLERKLADILFDYKDLGVIEEQSTITLKSVPTKPVGDLTLNVLKHTEQRPKITPRSYDDLQLN